MIPDTEDFAGSAGRALADYVAGTLEALRPCSGAILVSKRGEPLFERYLRGREPQDTITAIDRDSLWPWWSVTKSVTAALVARLAYKGSLSFDQYLSSVLPEFREHGPGPCDRRKVTLRSLLCHTSGCALPGRIEDGIDIGSVVKLSEIEVVSEPGSTFVYSALGMHILERFLETLAGENCEDLLRREILNPFGLGSFRYIYDSDISAGSVERVLPCLDGKIAASQSLQHCGLGLYGTARDLLTFGERWLSLTDASGKRWCSPELRSEMWSLHSIRPSDSSEYGLLWWLFRETGGYVASGASFCVCGILPREGIVVAVSRNHFGPVRQPFDYRADKMRLLDLAKYCFTL